MSRTMPTQGFLYHCRLIMTKLCGGVGFTTDLAGQALSVRLFQRSLPVLARLD